MERRLCRSSSIGALRVMGGTSRRPDPEAVECRRKVPSLSLALSPLCDRLPMGAKSAAPPIVKGVQCDHAVVWG
ncbi:hypothetical protein HPB50_025651 [Hyalomma asiaticum]|uniref:Uncharacterized protein n=1 Tax=Hyalomma asiaticum TaxID=266040 RepID=A0ACB7TQX1_HYAAI|nr:hypothetical protein HPB50_025651 [Hyalomma asiaticum]